jgi:hypothetical protein
MCLLPHMSKQDAFTFFLPGKLFVMCETHVGLAGRYFSRDFVCSSTHSCDKATSCGFIGCFICHCHNLVDSSVEMPACP